MKISKEDLPLPRCYFSHCKIPNYTDQHRPPTKQQPFKAINQHCPAHTIDLVLPEELYAAIEENLTSKNFNYARVYMSLLDVISGDFFNQYIKAGNVVMRSEGQPGIQNIFLLKDSVLSLDIDKSTYERCGLVGVATPSPGRKHVKSRFRVELDLRLPSMQHGKKGFERIKWAFQNVLNESLAWVFIDLEHEDIISGPIAELHPQSRKLTPIISRTNDVIPPFVCKEDTIHDPLHEEQLLEWIGLLTLGSPRVKQSDTVDSYLCRYALPEAFNLADGTASQAQTLVHLRWHGFASMICVRHIWLVLRTGIADITDQWFSLSANTFENTSFTVLCHDSQNLMLWECD